MAANDFSRENFTSLNSDGISEDLFKLLWARDELNFSPSINIPDTIFYKHGQPTAWYFTASDGRIKKKNKHNLVSAKIELAFNKYVLGYDVVAFFISMPSELDIQQHRDVPTVVEYYDRVSLNSFLYNHKKDAHGILQRFVEPKSTHNELIRAIWSPKLCLLERAENIHELHDKRHGLYERTVVYEGPEYYFTAEPLRGPVLSGELQKQCEGIVAHIGEVTLGQKRVSRIVLSFKVDSRDKIWLLYSTSIRSQDMLEYSAPGETHSSRKLLNIDSVVSLRHDIHLNPQKSYEKPRPKVHCMCLSCAEETLEEKRCPITYKTIMKHYEHVLLILQSTASSTQRRDETIPWPPDAEMLRATGNVGFGCLRLEDNGAVQEPTVNDRRRRTSQLRSTTRVKRVNEVQVPPILQYLHPKLTADTYLRCKDDPLFQNKTIFVCENCFLVFAEFATMLLRMGENLRKLLQPGQHGAEASTSLMSSTSHTIPRPKSADWRAISTAALSAGEDMHASQSRGRQVPKSNSAALERAIGLRSSDTRHQPELPKVCRTASESQLASPEPFYGGNLENHDMSMSTGLYDPEHVSSQIAARERQFFQDISLNPQLRDHHPLQHILTAQKKLKLVDEQSGVLMKTGAQGHEPIFGTKFGKQESAHANKFSVYGQELPYAINGDIVLPSDLQRRTREKLQKTRAKKQSALRLFLEKQQQEEGEQINRQHEQNRANAAATQASDAKDIVASSQQYRAFLSDSLQRLGSQIQSANEAAAKDPAPPRPDAKAAPAKVQRTAPDPSVARTGPPQQQAVPQDAVPSDCISTHSSASVAHSGDQPMHHLDQLSVDQSSMGQSIHEHDSFEFPNHSPTEDEHLPVPVGEGSVGSLVSGTSNQAMRNQTNKFLGLSTGNDGTEAF